MSSDPSDKPKINGYECPTCGYRIVTIDRDVGVTPFMIGCQNDEATPRKGAIGKNGCGDFMQSCFYRVPQHLKPSHEWYSRGRDKQPSLRRIGDTDLIWWHSFKKKRRIEEVPDEL